MSGHPGEVETCLERLKGASLSRGTFQHVSDTYRNIEMISGEDRDRIPQEFVHALVMEGLETPRGQLLLFCISEILALECSGNSATRACCISSRVADVIYDHLALQSHGAQNTVSLQHDDWNAETWWARLCSNLVSIITSLSRIDVSSAEWMFALMLSCSRSRILQVHPNLQVQLAPVVFEATFSGVSELFDTNHVSQYSLLCALMDDVLAREAQGDDVCLSSSISFGCLAAMIVALPEGTARHQISKILYHQYSKQYANTNGVIGCAMALHRVHEASLSRVSGNTFLAVPASLETHDSILCILRASMMIVSNKHGTCEILPKHMLDILGRHPPLPMQCWVLEELQLQSMQFYDTHCMDDMAESSHIFDFAMQIVDLSTRGMTVMHPKAPALIIDIMCCLNAWRPLRASLFKLLVLRMMDILQRLPEYTQPVVENLHGMVVGGTHPTAIQASRVHLLLSMLLPCCHSIDSASVVGFIAPSCLSLLCSSWDHTSLALVINDMYCSMFAHPGLQAEEVQDIALEYVRTCLMILQENDAPHLFEYFSTGFVTSMRSCPDSCITFLDIVLDKCLELSGNHSTILGIFQSAAYSLDVVSLKVLPLACSRLTHFFATLKKTSPGGYHACRRQLLDVIQGSQDITRLPYVAQHFSSIVSSSSSASTL